MTIIKPKVVRRGPMTVVRIGVRTNNPAEANSATTGVWQLGLENRLAKRIAHRTDPKVTIAVYTN